MHAVTMRHCHCTLCCVLPDHSLTNPISALLVRSPFNLEIHLPPAQGSLHATDDSLEQRYFPAAHSHFGGPLFTHAAPSQGPTQGPSQVPTQGPLVGQPWPSLNQGPNRNTPLGEPSPHPSPYFQWRPGL